MEKQYWGYHLVIDMTGSEYSKAKVKDKEYLDKWIRDLVKNIDMIPYGEPQIVHFADHCEEKAGNTVVQLIETSNIMAHFMDNTGGAYIDVFSCKKFEAETVLNQLEELFKPKFINYVWVKRIEVENTFKNKLLRFVRNILTNLTY